MELSGSGKSPNSSLSFRYNANNEELEELYHMCDDDPPTPQNDPPVSQNETASPKKADKSSSILDKYFKSMRPEKPSEKENEDPKSDPKPAEETKPAAPPKEVTSSPMKEYLNRLGKRATTSEGSIDAKESSNETWKIFHDFKFKIAQAVEDIKTRSVEETKEKSVPRENSTSDSEESSAIKDSDQQSVGDTDNQVSSLHSSIQNLSEITQPVTAKPTDRESSLPLEKNNSESSDDTHKNLASESENGTGDLLDDSSMLEVESGVEALEDTNIDALGDANLYKDSGDKPPPVLNILPCTVQRPRTPTHIGSPPSKPNITTETPRNYFFNFTMYILTFLLIVNYFLFPNSHAWNGFLLGVWMFTFASNLKQWFLANYFSTDKEPRTSFFQFRRRSVVPYTYNIPNVKEHRPIKKHEGWINHYRFHEYDAYTYHINKTTTAFIKLEGCNLRISYTKTKIAKRALWDEKIDKVVFYQHRLYNLTGAKVFLLPNGLVSKRQWSKKYPICIALNENETIQVLEKENLPEKKPGDVSESKKKEQESETTETTTSPEKKKRFVWRKKEKSLSQEVDTAGREGLRHRIVRKMHRDKKPDSVSTATEPDSQTEKTLQEELNEDEVTSAPANGKDEALDEDLDDEITRLKEFLDETEPETVEGAAEGEWSLHVKHSKDKHSRLFLFARTGRDKLEWFRRIHQAISEATPSVESSVAEDKSSSDLATDTKEGIEMAVYKVSDKDTVSFPKPNTKANPVPLEGLTVVSDWSSYEKTFWPYLIKIMQTHEENIKQTVDAGVTCDLDPTPIETKGKAKKKRKNDPKSDTPSCDCRQLPAEVSWVNTVLARVMYDVMRDPHIMMRVQNRIQRKLNTLKLPSFMSPLVVTELSLAGACPLVERVGGATWDERGVWLDADLRYDGGAAITILTNINLMKLKEKNLTLEEKLLLTEEHIVESDLMFSGSSMFSEKQLRKRKPAIFDSDVEDSAESSSDDESPPVQPVDSNEAIPTQDIASAAAPESGSSKKKFLRMVDKISTNKYFQQVTDFKYVKRAMEGLSNTDIKLQVEIQGLEGRLALNLPPPPHDRLWLGFRTNPQLILKARPAVGARTLRFAHISNWIEHKLSKEFEKVLVLPNMEDIAVDVMTPTPVFAESL